MQKVALVLLRFYQRAISPHMRSQCKFYPSCSEYAILSIKKYGLIKGASKAIYRILRCNPVSKGGVDFP